MKLLHIPKRFIGFMKFARVGDSACKQDPSCLERKEVGGNE